MSLQIVNLNNMLQLPTTTVSSLNLDTISNGIVTSSNGTLSSIPNIDTTNLSTTLQTRLTTIETNISNLDTDVNALSSISDGIVTSSNGTLSSISKIDTTNLSTTLQTRLTTIETNISNLSSNSGSENYITLDDTVGLVNSVAETNITNFARTWSQLTNSPTDNGVGISCSSNGQYILKLGWGAPCYLSNDFGNTWNAVSQIGSYQMFSSMSASGQYILVSGFLSSNYGVSWSNIQSFNDSKISETGKYMVLATSSGIYYSNNFGATFTNCNVSGTNTWNSVAISADGSTAIAVRGTSPVTIWKTTNYGTSWSEIYSNPSNVSLGNISCSNDGKYILVALTQGTSGKMYLSTNYGSSFSSISSLSDSNYFKVAMSSNGMYMVSACNSGYVYYSQNYGSSWSQSSLSNSNYYGICMSKNANYIYAYAPGSKTVCFNANITSITTSQPNNPSKGGMYFDESTNKLWIYNSTSSAWKSVTLA